MKSIILALATFFATTQLQAGWFSSDQDDVTKTMTALVNLQRQSLIEKWHLLAASKKVEMHEVTMIDRTGSPTKSSKQMIGCVVRCTIRWEGPINKDGYTKLALLYDNEVKRFTAYRVISTNGILNSDAAAGAVDFLDGLLKH